MAASEWLRTFVAIYRSSSVTAGAARRGLSQPAASQQLAGLERRAGAPLFIRTAGGVEPTRRGRELYLQVAEQLDRLEPLLVKLDGGVGATPPPTIRFGSSAEYFSFEVVPRFDPSGPTIAATFGADDELIALLEGGELDVAVTSTTPARRSIASTPIDTKHFVLVAPPPMMPDPPLTSMAGLARWLVGKPWVAYSEELPMTRRFWLSGLGRPFAADLRLVAPDLRAVVGAVERGHGISLLPTFVCSEQLARGSITEVFPVSDTLPAEPWFANIRVGDVGRHHISAFARRLEAPPIP
ncbi:MAG TPA: LysR family transcriptional regulator [Acidimicrobiales bacterium]|jgi:DNA-binding transcriptional LysR family regulator|nr:LysR family transcriptional regulator [Acidimicrobiales bacterium]